MSDMNHFNEWKERVDQFRQQYNELTKGGVDSLEAKLAADLLDQMEELGEILKQPVYTSDKIPTDVEEELFQHFDIPKTAYEKELVSVCENDSSHILPFPIKDEKFKDY